MKKIFTLSSLLFTSLAFQAQTGYDIRITLKNQKDTVMYLGRYYYDQTVVVDTARNIKNGVIQFKGNTVLDKGTYILVTQEKGRLLDFLVNSTAKFSITGDKQDMINSLKTSDKENEQLFSYAKFMTQKEKEFRTVQSAAKGKADSAKIVSEKAIAVSKELKIFETNFLERNKGMFVADFINLKNEHFPTDIPKAANGRPDSIYQYRWYKNHYFDGVNFKDERIMFTPFFADRFKKYFNEVIPQNPDSVIKEIDNIMSRCEEGSMLYNTLIGQLAYKYETDKSMSFDQYGNANTMEKVFVHLGDKYITSGKTNGYYSDETIHKIKERTDIIRNLLPGAKVPDLYMIDTANGRRVLKMGFDTARTSAGVTYLYNKNREKIDPLFKTLYDIKAKYTILVFWAADCGHCKTEVPLLNDTLNAIRGKVDFKVFAVQTKEDLISEWEKFIIDKKLTDFIHVFDPIHLNNTKERFDINATPIIYLLDKDKRIKAKRITPQQAVEIINALEQIEKENQ